MYVCMYVCMYVFMYVCMHTYNVAGNMYQSRLHPVLGLLLASGEPEEAPWPSFVMLHTASFKVIAISNVLNETLLWSLVKGPDCPSWPPYWDASRPMLRIPSLLGPIRAYSWGLLRALRFGRRSSDLPQDRPGDYLVVGLTGLIRAYYGGLSGILSGLTESTDHPSRP